MTVAYPLDRELGSHLDFGYRPLVLKLYFYELLCSESALGLISAFLETSIDPTRASGSIDGAHGYFTLLFASPVVIKVSARPPDLG